MRTKIIVITPDTFQQCTRTLESMYYNLKDTAVTLHAYLETHHFPQDTLYPFL